MKELLGNTSNILMIEGKDSKPSALVEVVIVTSEPKYISDGSSGFTRVRDVENFRFCTQAKQLRMLATSFLELAKDAEEMESRTTIEPEAQP